MRINDMKYGFNVYQNQQNRSNTNTNNTAKKTTSSVDVNISARGREISQAFASEQTQRQDRVQELKKQIADGTYHVDSKKLADKFLDFWK